MPTYVAIDDYGAGDVLAKTSDKEILAQQLRELLMKCGGASVDKQDLFFKEIVVYELVPLSLDMTIFVE